MSGSELFHLQCVEQLVRNCLSNRCLYTIVCLATPVSNGYLPAKGIFTCFAVLLMFDIAELGVFWLRRSMLRGFSHLPLLGWEQFFFCLVLLLEVLLWVYHLSFGFNGRLRWKLNWVPAPLYRWSGSCHHYARPWKQKRARWRTAPALTVCSVTGVSVSLPCVAQHLSMVGSSRFLFSFPKLGRKLGAGRRSMSADGRGWRAGGV